MARTEHDGASTIRHEEELHVGTRRVGAGSVIARKFVDEERAERFVSRDLERAEIEYLDPTDTDTGEVETLPDGSISIPLFEERLVVTKQLVVRERVILHRRVDTEEIRVEEDLRSERIEIDVED